jgi:thioredoxin 1
MIIINTVKLNDNNYDEVVSSGLTLVDVFADWCGPCKVISPIIDELSSDYQGQVVFGKLNVDEAPEKTTELGVRNIPTILVYKDGQIVERNTGAVSKNQLKELIDKHL